MSEHDHQVTSSRRHSTASSHLLTANTPPPDTHIQPSTRSSRRKLLSNIIFILIWYILATFLSMYNKWMFSARHLGFRFPLLVTGVHQLVQMTFSALIMWNVPHIRPERWMKPREYL
jgi:solute carrier family 35 protein C2